MGTERITNIYIDRRLIIKDERFSNCKRVPFIKCQMRTWEKKLVGIDHTERQWASTAPSSNLEE